MSYNKYFVTIAKIWKDFFAEKIGMSERDRRLKHWRELLAVEIKQRAAERTA